MIASRVPDGFPSECPLCGAKTQLAIAVPNEDATCHKCGCLIEFSTNTMLRIQDFLSRKAQLQGTVSPNDPILPLPGSQIDSLQVVQLVMEFEEEFDLQIPDDAAAKSPRTWGDLVRLLERAHRESGE